MPMVKPKKIASCLSFFQNPHKHNGERMTFRDRRKRDDKKELEMHDRISQALTRIGKS